MASASPRVAVVDYGAGNLRSVAKAVERCGLRAEVSGDAAALAAADAVVLPGVGAFADSMADMRDCGLVEPVRAFAANGGPLLGICLGMQMLFAQSEEFGVHQGLGLIPGMVAAIPPTGADGIPHRIPHMGWNEITAPEDRDWEGTILDGVEPGTSVYFAHSFMAFPGDRSHRLADSDYDGRTVSAVVRSGNTYGCQFHPEKSGETGLNILRNFIALQ